MVFRTVRPPASMRLLPFRAIAVLGPGLGDALSAFGGLRPALRLPAHRFAEAR
jgi:hypothetical protein